MWLGAGEEWNSQNLFYPHWARCRDIRPYVLSAL